MAGVVLVLLLVGVVVVNKVAFGGRPDQQTADSPVFSNPVYTRSTGASNEGELYAGDGGSVTANDTHVATPVGILASNDDTSADRNTRPATFDDENDVDL